MGSKKWVDYYSILDVDRYASAEEIKKAYRSLMQKYHPDLYVSEPEDKQKEAEEKTKDINEAYEVLGNEAKKESYDREWDARANGTYQEQDFDETNTDYEEQEYQAPDVDYEDVNAHYTEEEKRYAEQLSLKKIIEEELAKAVQIIALKNEVIYNGYTGALEKREYLDTIREFINFAMEYIASLEELKSKAYEYDLLQEETVIKETIEFLESEIKDLPLTPKDAEMRCKKEELREGIKAKIDEQLSKKDVVIGSLNGVLLLAYRKEILSLDYNAYLEPLLLEAYACLSELTELAKAALKLELKDEVDKVREVMAELSAKIVTIPEVYEEAQTMGYIEDLKERMTVLLNFWNTVKDKTNRISALLSKYQNSSRYEKLYAYCIDLFEETKAQLKTMEAEMQNKKIKNVDKEKLASEYSNQATEMYEKAEKCHTEAQSVYENVKSGKGTYNSKTINYLTESSAALWDKNAAFELLLEAEKVLAAMKAGEMQDKEFESIYFNLKVLIEEVVLQRQVFEEMHVLERNANPYRSFKDQDFIDKLNELKNEIKSKIIAGTIVCIGGLWGLSKVLPTVEDGLTLGKIMGIACLAGIISGGIDSYVEAYRRYVLRSDIQTKYLEYLARKNAQGQKKQ